MEVLITHEKHGDYYYDISTPKKADKVYLYLVNKREKLGYYDGIEEKEQIRLVKALGGDAKSAKLFLQMRNGAEYESIEYDDVIEVE